MGFSMDQRITEEQQSGKQVTCSEVNATGRKVMPDSAERVAGRSEHVHTARLHQKSDCHAGTTRKEEEDLP